MPADRRRRFGLRRLLPLIVLLIAAAADPLPAYAHATLVRVSPAPGAVLTRAPSVVRVVFDDFVQPGPGVAAVRNGAGSVLAGRARVIGGKTLVVRFAMGFETGTTPCDGQSSPTTATWSRGSSPSQ